MSMTDEIPIVDLSKCGLQVAEPEICDEAIHDVGKMLYKAFTTSGFVYLTNHGFPNELIDEMNKIAEKFYSLPLEEKTKYCLKKVYYGYDPVEATRLNPNRESDYYEGFRVTGLAFDDENTPWPQVPMFKESFRNFADLCKTLLLRLLKALGTAMRLKDPEYFCKCHSMMNKTGNTSMLKINCYPPVPTKDGLRENQLRIAEHTDWTTLILLFQDQTGGLQAKRSNGEFSDVTPIPGTIVVNLGETMQKWSGGRLRATQHRVVPPSDKSKRMNIRRSIVYFGQADNNVLMEEFEYQDGFHDKESTYERNKLTVEQYIYKRFADTFY